MRAIAAFLLPALAGFAVASLAFRTKVIPGIGSPPTQKLSGEFPQDAGPRERLEHLVKGDDPLGSAGRVIRWLDQATADDFRELGKNMDEFPSAKLWSTDQFADAYADAVVRRWAQVDLDGLMAVAARHQYLVNDRDAEGVHDADWLLGGIGRTYPELALEKLPLITQYESLANHAWNALETLAARDANAARRVLDRIETPDARKSAKVAIADGLAKTDPAAAVALALEIEEERPFLFSRIVAAAERIGPGTVRQVVAATPAGKIDRATLARLVLLYPGIADDLAKGRFVQESSFSTAALESVAERTSVVERERFFASYETLPVEVRERLAVALASTWARTEPAKAAEWAVAHAEPTRHESKANDAARGVFNRWFYSDSEAALEWWKSLPASPLRDALGNEASTLLADQDRIAQAVALYEPLSGEDQGAITHMLAQGFARRDPLAAASWIASLPPEVPIEDAVQSIVSRWMPRDPEGIAQWMDSLPGGPRRDQVISQFIEAAVTTGARGSKSWVLKIGDPVLRETAAESAYPKIDDRAAAREWMRHLDGVDLARHARFLRTME